MRHTARVLVQPSDTRGRPTASSIATEGTAVVSSPRLPEITTKVKAKYGFVTKVTKALARLRHPVNTPPYADGSIAITLAE